MIADLQIGIADFGSKTQTQSIFLRYEILRKPLNLNFTPKDLAAEANQIHVVVKSGALVVGCLLLVPVDENTIKMRQVAVSGSFQNKGIGAKMVAFSEQYARQNGYNTMELHARETAVPFYLKLQYDIIGDPFEEVGIPHRKMVKNL